MKAYVDSIFPVYFHDSQVSEPMPPKDPMADWHDCDILRRFDTSIAGVRMFESRAYHSASWLAGHAAGYKYAMKVARTVLATVLNRTENDK